MSNAPWANRTYPQEHINRGHDTSYPFMQLFYKDPRGFGDLEKQGGFCFFPDQYERIVGLDREKLPAGWDIINIVRGENVVEVLATANLEMAVVAHFQQWYRYDESRKDDHGRPLRVPVGPGEKGESSTYRYIGYLKGFPNVPIMMTWPGFHKSRRGQELIKEHEAFVRRAMTIVAPEQSFPGYAFFTNFVMEETMTETGGGKVQLPTQAHDLSALIEGKKDALRKHMIARFVPDGVQDEIQAVYDDIVEYVEGFATPAQSQPVEQDGQTNGNGSYMQTGNNGSGGVREPDGFLKDPRERAVYQDASSFTGLAVAMTNRTRTPDQIATHRGELTAVFEGGQVAEDAATRVHQLRALVAYINQLNDGADAAGARVAATGMFQSLQSVSI